MTWLLALLLTSPLAASLAPRFGPRQLTADCYAGIDYDRRSKTAVIFVFSKVPWRLCSTQDFQTWKVEQSGYAAPGQFVFQVFSDRSNQPLKYWRVEKERTVQ